MSEYGVHWNFFLTLAGVALCTAAASPPPQAAAAAALALLAAHNTALAHGLEEYVVGTERDWEDIVSMNKEGLASLPAYWALYLVGTVAGRALLSEPALRGTAKQRAVQRVRAWRGRAAWLGAAAAALWGATWLAAWLGLRPSRRLLNGPYVL